jgi:hypothetical protein
MIGKISSVLTEIVPVSKLGFLVFVFAIAILFLAVCKWVYFGKILFQAAKIQNFSLNIVDFGTIT